MGGEKGKHSKDQDKAVKAYATKATRDDNSIARIDPILDDENEWAVRVSNLMTIETCVLRSTASTQPQTGLTLGPRPKRHSKEQDNA